MSLEKTNIIKNLAITKGLNFIVKHLYKFLLANAKSVIFQNQDNRKLFVDLALVEAEKCYRVFGSGVDTIEYQQQPLPKQATTFLLIARLLGDKSVTRAFVSLLTTLKS